MNEQHAAPSADRQAIAEQVIISAGNILVAAGFSGDEIGHIFRQAADHLSPPQPPLEAVRPSEPTGLRAMHEAFRRSKPVSDLQPLIARAAALPSFDQEGPQLKVGFDLAMQMAPLLADAQNSLRALAEQSGLALFATRDEWMLSGGTTDPTGASASVCLEDFEAHYGGAFEAIGSVLEALLRREDAEAFTFLLGHLAENGVVIDQGLRDTIEKGMRLAQV